MKDLENALKRLPKATPDKSFLNHSKNRLMNRIEFYENETWFKAFLKHLGVVLPSKIFVSQAKIRIMQSIRRVRQPLWVRALGLQNKLAFVKRLATSTLIMVIAVTTTLFFVEGQRVVSASEDTYIEVLQGGVKVKHADRLIWDEITDHVDLLAGDLIRLDEEAEAVIHFFDDTQLRLADKSTLLISQLAYSPAYAEQGAIEVSLHEGNAWVQTLNVEDGYAGFTLITRNAIIKALNATFDVHSNLKEPTYVNVFKNKLEIETLLPDTREIADTFKVIANKKLNITSTPGSSQKPLVAMSTLTEQDMVEEWVQNNLQKDHEHLAQLREDGLNRLKQTAGTLPGDMLYPIKQAKERLKMALSFGESDTNTQIEIANKRLNEAIVLLQEGDRHQAMHSLMAYQSIARQIAEETKYQEEIQQELTHLLITPHQKTLVASLPSAVPINMVKEALNEAEELLIDNPIERERVRLENSVERLRDVESFIQSGNLNAAKEALVNHELVTTAILDDANNIEDNEEKKNVFNTILELRSEELDLIKTISSQIGEKNTDSQLMAMISNAELKAEEEVERTIAFIEPIMPEVVQSQIETPIVKSNIDIIVEKVNIYKTWQGQKNQIERLLKEEGITANNVNFLTELRDNLSGRARDYLNTKILELQRIAKLNKSKAIKRKIDRAKRLRENE